MCNITMELHFVANNCIASSFIVWKYIDGLVKERRNSSALAMEFRLFAFTHRYAFYASASPKLTHIDC